jgi:hypothetical protein
MPQPFSVLGTGPNVLFEQQQSVSGLPSKDAAEVWQLTTHSVHHH